MDAKMALFKKWLKGAGLKEHEYQLAGMKFCLERECDDSTVSGVYGGIIADDMGLGKTILMLGCIISNFKGKKSNNTLVVLPTALLQQWCNIFERFMGHSPLVYHGAAVKTITSDELNSRPIVVTTYGMIAERLPKKGGKELTGKRSPLWDVCWNRVILDEAHHIRNKGTAVFKGAMKLQARIRWLVTGTPIQNKLTDLYALCMFLGLGPTFYTNPSGIRQILSTFLLRRTKKQVGINLIPVKNEQIVVPWTSASEKDMAVQIHQHANFCDVTVDNVDHVIGLLAQGLPMFIRARQMCVFPHLLQDAVRTLQERGDLSWDVNLKKVKTCSKMTAIAKHIKTNTDEYDGRRKIVFCHFRGEIDMLKALLRKAGIGCDSVDGRTNKKQRDSSLGYAVGMGGFSLVCKEWCGSAEWLFPLIDKFVVPQVLIVQIQTANEGLNLQHFQDIYFTSPHWNPAVESQAVARAHRIGQTGEVRVYRFIMENFESEGGSSITIDRYCQIVQDRKKELMQILET